MTIWSNAVPCEWTPPIRERFESPTAGPLAPQQAWVYDDGGRAAAGFRGRAGDCVVRAIAIATGRGYRAVYDDLHDLMSVRRRAGAPRRSPRDGVSPKVWRPYVQAMGWAWTPTMFVGSGTMIHLAAKELPEGRLIVQCSRHLVAVIDGVIHDVSDPSRGGTRAVYGMLSEGH